MYIFQFKAVLSMYTYSRGYTWTRNIIGCFMSQRPKSLLNPKPYPNIRSLAQCQLQFQFCKLNQEIFDCILSCVFEGSFLKFFQCHNIFLPTPPDGQLLKVRVFSSPAPPDTLPWNPFPHVCAPFVPKQSWLRTTVGVSLLMSLRRWSSCLPGLFSHTPGTALSNPAYIQLLPYNFTQSGEDRKELEGRAQPGVWCSPVRCR